MSRELSEAERARRQAWLQEVGEASVLAGDDPQRQAVEAEVRRRGGWALAYWEALLEESDVWRTTLTDPALADPVPPPADLATRLKAIADQHAPLAMVDEHPNVTSARGPRRLWMLAAAMIVASVAAWSLWGSAGQPSAEDPWSRAVDEVALLALNDHLDTHEQEVYASDAAALTKALQPHIAFPIQMPNLGPAIEPVGGRPCTLGSHPVAFSAWRGPRGRLTLIQLRRSDFGLPADMPLRTITPTSEAAQGRPLEVLFFGQGDTVWVVVADAAEDLRLVRKSVGSS